jgi:hypothetical protein
MAGILSGMPPDCTSHTIYNEERKRRKRRCVEEEILDTNIDVPELEPALNKGGRPLGATNEAKRDREEREGTARADAVKALLETFGKSLRSAANCSETIGTF